MSRLTWEVQHHSKSIRRGLTLRGSRPSEASRGMSVASREAIKTIILPSTPAGIASEAELITGLPAPKRKRSDSGSRCQWGTPEPLRAGCRKRGTAGREGRVLGLRHLRRTARRKKVSVHLRPMGEAQKHRLPRGEATRSRYLEGARRTRGPIFACSATSIRKRVQHTFSAGGCQDSRALRVSGQDSSRDAALYTQSLDKTVPFDNTDTDTATDTDRRTRARTRATRTHGHDLPFERIRRHAWQLVLIRRILCKTANHKNSARSMLAELIGAELRMLRRRRPIANARAPSLPSLGPAVFDIAHITNTMLPAGLQTECCALACVCVCVSVSVWPRSPLSAMMRRSGISTESSRNAATSARPPEAVVALHSASFRRAFHSAPLAFAKEAMLRNIFPVGTPPKDA